MLILHISFKPYYKWNTFNTLAIKYRTTFAQSLCFKPYYKWNTFNTDYDVKGEIDPNIVLNLIINGIPSIQNVRRMCRCDSC